jgi:hypothetical protein
MNTRGSRHVFQIPQNVNALCYYLRTSRSISQASMASYCHVKSVDIHKFEKAKQERVSGIEIFPKYIEALQSEDMVLTPYQVLTPKQAEIIFDLYGNRSDNAIRILEEELAAIDLRDILPETHPPYTGDNGDFGELFADFQEEARPALIRDDLWFDHAINGKLCNLFDIQLQEDGKLPPFFNAWHGWHSLGIKFDQISPVRKSYEKHDQYFIPAVFQYFFETRETSRYLFTWQMQQLLREFYNLSGVNKRRFERWLHNALTFSTDYEIMNSIIRTITYKGKQAVFRLTDLRKAPATFKGGYTIRYTLGVWQAQGSDAEEIIELIQGNNSIYYAADYDTAKPSFHVNNWR